MRILWLLACLTIGLVSPAESALRAASPMAGDGVPRTGAPGPAGPQGDPGTVGPQGDPGQPGVAGPKGDAGNDGPKGNTGAAGAAGATGPAGTTGTPGATGPAGPAGAKGEPGSAGSAGPQGLTGAKGDAGERGADRPVPVGPVDLLVLVVLPALLGQLDSKARQALLAPPVPPASRVPKE